MDTLPCEQLLSFKYLLVYMLTNDCYLQANHVIIKKKIGGD